MKNTKTKKLTVAIALILGASCAFGATACNKSGSEPASVKVDEEGWTAAFERTLNSLNFTMEYSSNYTYYGANSSRTNSKRDSFYNVTENSSYEKITFLENNNKRIHESYNVLKDTGYYFCIKSINNDGGLSGEEDWQITYISESWSPQYIYILSNMKDYFSDFTYTDGAYYRYRTEGNQNGNERYISSKTYIKINSEGYVSYFKTELTQIYPDYSDYYETVFKAKQINIDEIKLTNFENTSVSIPEILQNTIENV